MSKTTTNAPSVTLVHTGNNRTLGMYTSEDAGEPLRLHIGKQVVTHSLQRVAIRYGLDLGSLVAFRDDVTDSYSKEGLSHE